MLMVPSDVAYMKVICVHMFAHLPFRRALTDALGAPPNLAPLDSPLSAGVRPTLPLAGLSQSDWSGSHVTRYIESSNVSSKSSPANPPHM